MCLYPTLIKNRKYTLTKKNGGNIPPVTDERTKYVPIGCQKCIECRKRKSREWQTRLLEDIKTNRNGKFITLTFSNESIKKLYEEVQEKFKKYKKEPPEGYILDNEIATLAIRLFLERWRKQYKKSLRHWLVTEIGHEGTENIHLHGIIWTNENLNEVEKHWQYGWVWKGKRNTTSKYDKNMTYTNYVNERTIGYICKYVTKVDLKHKEFKPIILTSPGMGNNYTKTFDSRLNKFNNKDTNELYRTRTGHKMSMPIYWRNKLYTEQQREQLWLNKLNLNIRYVLKRPIDISKNFTEYDKAIITARKHNRELGYGGEQTTKEELQYKRDRRQIQILTRIAKAKNNTLPTLP